MMYRTATAFLLFNLLFNSCGSSKKSLITTKKPTWEENFNQKTHFDTTKWTKIPRGRSDWNRRMSDYDSCYAMRVMANLFYGVL